MLNLGRRAAELGLLEDLTLSELLDGAEELPVVNLTLTAQVKDEKLTAFSCKGTAKVNGPFPVDMDIDMSGTPLSLEGSASFKGAYLGKVELSAKSSAAVTTKSAPTAPPAGAEILDWEDLWDWE